MAHKASKGSNCIPWNGPLDTDGIQLCPPSPSGPWGLTSCAFAQAREWVRPTETQKQQMRSLMRALKAKDSPAILNYADKLNLRVCRVKKTDAQNNLTDSYLVLATKPGVRNYSGPFIYYRELNPSNYVHHVPHDGTDRTAPALGQVFEKTRALVSIHNGQRKGIGPAPAICTRKSHVSDSAHSTNNLHWPAFTEAMSDPNTMCIEFHGMAGTHGRGMIITNGMRRPVGPNSLLYAFCQAVANRFKNFPEAQKKLLTVTAPGTPLTFKYNPLCDTWVQGRYLNGAGDAAQCRLSKTPSNRFVGFENGVTWVADPNIISPVLQELERTYPVPRPV